MKNIWPRMNANEREWIRIAIVALAAVPLAAQDEPIFRAGTTLATVSFHVIRDKHYVDDLKVQDLVLSRTARRGTSLSSKAGDRRYARLPSTLRCYSTPAGA